MTGDRWSRVLAAFGSVGPDGDGDGDGHHARPATSLCETARDLLHVSATSVLLMSSLYRGRLCAADDVAAALDDLQFTTGDGPSIDACTGVRLVSEAHLTGADTRWPTFAPAAVGAGIGAVFAYPLRVGAARLGALTLYQREAGPLSAEQRATAAIVADVLTLHVIATQAAAHPGELAEGLTDVAMHRAEVHQAGGMVSAQLEVGIVEALIRLRGHAFANSRTVADVAADVIARRLRFT